MRETPSVVPDRIEPVVAYRAWNVINNNPDFLYSCGWSCAQWKPNEILTAIHDGYSSNSLVCRGMDRCPGSTASRVKCGIYGMKIPRTIPFGNSVFWETIGEVYLWGLIIEHEKGYRAEYAYPKCLYLVGVNDKQIKMIASNYRIPAVEQPAMEPQPHFNSLVNLQRDTYNAISGYTGV